MSGFPIVLAGASFFAEGAFHVWLVSKSGVSIFFVVAGAMCAVIVAAFVWAAFFRKQGGRRSHRHRHRRKYSTPEAAKNPAAEPGSPDGRHSGRRHRRRKRKRPANPTLAETGGLPPVRDPNSGPPLI